MIQVVLRISQQIASSSFAAAWHRQNFKCGNLHLIPTFLEETAFTKSLQSGLLVQCVHAHVCRLPIELNTAPSCVLINVERRMDKERVDNPPNRLSLLLFDKLRSTLSQVQNQNFTLSVRVATSSTYYACTKH